MTDVIQPPHVPAPSGDLTSPKPSLALRILRFPLTLLILGFVWFIFCYGLSGYVSGRLLPVKNTPLQPVVAAGFAVFCVYCYKGWRIWIEGGADAEFSWAGWLRELGLGLLLGFLLFSAMTGIVALLGGFEVLGLRGMGQLWPMITLAILSAFFEETLFRGVMFRQVEAMLGTWAALAITSAFFGLAHLGNPGASWFSSFAIALEAGILLGAAYLLTRRLWLPIGIHAAWNFTQGWLFSIPVSGGDAPLGLLITRRVGPEWLTGGDFGLEASAVAMLVATLAGLIMLRRAVRRDGVKPPMWVKG